MDTSELNDIRTIFNKRKGEIEERLKEFRFVLKRNNPRELFAEFAFCLLTPQSRAKTCWAAIETLKRTGTLYSGSPEEIEKHLFGVRFKRNKSKYIAEAREKFFKNGKFTLMENIASLPSHEAREWLVKNVKGMGMKEASHFLRNIGLGEDLAILDRHILKNLKALKVIKDIPASISPKRYLNIEERMKKFSRDIGIPMSVLDLVFWCRETGEIFK
ncbi:MAG: N-glycosylase/DNA lyase [Candidatus Aminicenantes bacterium]|nr:N-glycosylase/DNA lyase [Candidatus Aminicenantes bacterium]